MSTRLLIDKVIRGETPTRGELVSFVQGYLSGEVSKEDATLFLRAVCECGLSDEGTILLTDVMLSSGKTLSFAPRRYPYADKHSTGGLSDSTTLIVAPVVASCGVPFLKMSGRKLGHTGGTIDKLELFRGYKTEMSVAEAEAVVEKVGAAVIAQSRDLVPADKALYKLRDETNTVKSLPLIASSVMSKKLASGAQVFALDVKTGNGAFMESVEDSVRLAKLMVKILTAAGKRAAVVISDMNSPLGDYVGGVLEVSDVMDVLEGKEGRLRDLSVALASYILSMAKDIPYGDAEREAADAINSGRAKSKLEEIVRAQGGETCLFEAEYRAQYHSRIAAVVRAEKGGYVSHIDCVALGLAAREAEKEGGYGIYVPYKVGARVEKGEALFVLHGENAPNEETVLTPLRSCVAIADKEVAPLPLIYDVIES